MQSNAMTELMSADIPHVDYNAKKKRFKKSDIAEWEKEMASIEGSKPQKINLNEFIIDGTFRNA